MSALPQPLARPAHDEAARVTVVVLTYNRADQVLDTLGRLAALPDRIDIVVVDNASSDDTATRVAQAFPFVELVVAPSNMGAAGRNLGVEKVRTEYVAFCDDDTWWGPGSLSRAADILDASPRVAVLSARVVVGENGDADETCERMRVSPLGANGLPGPALVGYMAGASVFRTSVYRTMGGYEPRLFIGGEESLLALDMLDHGHALVYADELVLHHHPSPIRDSALRRRLLARNAAWVAWLRLPLREAVQASMQAFAVMRREGTFWRDAMQMLRGLPWALSHRRVVGRHVQVMRSIVREDDRRHARQQASETTLTRADATRAV
ncbi:glycosyltransferase [Caballeronia sp. LZ062]|uniref:glycosyltransferase family 2 protein n=1 Tax=unclassified Caballeronia TaxID=2646786 RepID=UPI002861FF11|nr:MULTISPECIES: glycosyltransferase [unclassified Caballeronia]MDR5857409.1 glycosyltransferase [Caballeronia sp. LZ050]MDR5868960.1 glycosyltransferase [Caballeronia sp. LZ062]